MYVEVKCKKCNEAMCRSYPLVADLHCAACQAGNERNWEDLSNIKEAFFMQRSRFTIDESLGGSDIANLLFMSRDRVIAELERESEFKEKAQASGMIRPFLLLVAMPPFLRCQVCNALGLPLFNQPFFGDPHREAWYAINANACGLQVGY